MEIQELNSNNFLKDGVVYPKIYRAEIANPGFVNIFSEVDKPDLANAISVTNIIVKDVAGTTVADGSQDDENTIITEINDIVTRTTSGGAGIDKHNTLPDLQGGEPGAYYHLTLSQLLEVLKVRGKVSLADHSFDQLRDTANPTIANSLVVMTRDNIAGYAPLGTQVVIPSLSSTNDAVQEILQGTSAEIEFQTQVGDNSTLFNVNGNGIELISAQVSSLVISVQLILSVEGLETGDSFSGFVKIFKNSTIEVASAAISAVDNGNQFLVLKEFAINSVALNDVFTCVIEANTSTSTNAKYVLTENIYNLFTTYTPDVSTTLVIPQEYVGLPIRGGSGGTNVTVPAGINDVHIGQDDAVKIFGDSSFTVKDDKLVVKADGNVGIKTANPSKSLVVQSGGVFLPTIGGNNGIIFGVAETSSVYANGGNSIRIDTGGGNSYINVTNTGLGVLRNPSHRLDVNGNSRLSGNVGINTAPSGTHALKVDGAIEVTSIVDKNGSTGAAGQVLTADGSGGFEWI